MSTTPPSNRASGAIVSLGQPVVTVPFQYNPAALTRTLEPSLVGGQPGGRSEAVRFTGAPTETFSLDIELEGYDNLATTAQDNAAAAQGIFPALYALETLLYPPSATIQQIQNQLNQGVMAVAPVMAPPVLLSLGRNRVVPVQIQSLQVVEQAFDTQLNPLRAVVSLTARVLSYSDVIDPTIIARFTTYQQGKEHMAAVGQVNGTSV